MKKDGRSESEVQGVPHHPITLPLYGCATCGIKAAL